jgi:hypothetical protein
MELSAGNCVSALNLLPTAGCTEDGGHTCNTTQSVTLPIVKAGCPDCCARGSMNPVLNLAMITYRQTETETQRVSLTSS